MKQKLVLLIAAVVGLLAFATTHLYIKKTHEELYRNAEPVHIVVAKESLPEGTELRGEHLAFRKVFKSAVGQDVFRGSQKDLLMGKSLVYPVKKGDPLSWLHVGANLNELRNLSGLVPRGMRAMSIPVSTETAVSGLVRPNDHVDILGTFTFDAEVPGESKTVTFTVLQNVAVLATGTETANTGMQSTSKRRSSYNTITISVYPKEAELLAFAMHVNGSLTLTLRKPDDPLVNESSPPIDFQKLQKELPLLNQERIRKSGSGITGARER